MHARMLRPPYHLTFWFLVIDADWSPTQMGQDAHVLTFLVQHGAFLNIVAFKTTSDEWPDYHRLTKPGKREDALRDFSAFGPDILGLLKLAKPDLDVVR